MANVVESGEIGSAPSPLASWGHLAGYLAIMAGIAAMGFHAQHAAQVAGAGVESSGQPSQLIDHGQAIRNYLIDIAADCGLLYYCVAGVQWRSGASLGKALEVLSRGRWLTWRGLLRDVGVALPFWVLWETTAYGVHWILERGGPDTARSTMSMLPQSWVEIFLWIVLSIVAGVTEEMQSRGYLQQQLHALSGSVVFAVLVQGIVFGVGHSYQGWRQVIVISVLGVLYGTLAAWRRNLRANMMAHAWSDVWEGWLRWVVFR